MYEQYKQTTTTVRMEINPIFSFILLLIGAKNGAKIMSILTKMTEAGLLSWTTVRETAGHAKITASDRAGSLSVTITKPRAEYASPLEIELNYMAEGLVAGEHEKFVLDPGNFTTFDAAIWQKASATFKELHHEAVVNALNESISKSRMTIAN